MECTKFEELGLLYVSGELDDSDARQYEAHLEECPGCKRETEAYKADRASLFGPDMLGEPPPEAVNREIIRVCTASKKRLTMALVPMFIKKYAPVPVFLMLLMVAVGGYIKHHAMTAESMRAKLSTEAAQPQDTLHKEDMPPMIDYAEIVKADSGKADNSAPKTLGNLNAEGVVQVSGEGK
jgi:hypothetical protein